MEPRGHGPPVLIFRLFPPRVVILGDRQIMTQMSHRWWAEAIAGPFVLICSRNSALCLMERPLSLSFNSRPDIYKALSRRETRLELVPGGLCVARGQR